MRNGLVDTKDITPARESSRLNQHFQSQRIRTRRCLGSVPRLVLALSAVALICGCHKGSSPNNETRAAGLDQRPGLFAFDPFPTDMGLWECMPYMTALRGTVHEKTLHDLLKVRPHTYWEPAPRSALVVIPDELISADRLNAPMYLHLMRPEALESLEEMIVAAGAAGITLRVQSAYRSPSYQNALWKASLREFQFELSGAAFKTAPPCFSEHATGSAVDFATSRSGGEKFEESPTYRWLRDNASKWGWTQSFREDNGAVRSPETTGIMIEPWHFHHSSIDRDQRPNAL